MCHNNSRFNKGYEMQIVIIVLLVTIIVIQLTQGYTTKGGE